MAYRMCIAIVTHIALHGKGIIDARLQHSVASLLESFEMTKTGTLNLRVSLEFKRRLAEEAAKEKRSVTNYVEVTLTALWDRADSGSVQLKKRISTR